MVVVVSLTKALALDCEMVGVGAGGSKSALARVTLVSTNHYFLLFGFLCIYLVSVMLYC